MRADVVSGAVEKVRSALVAHDPFPHFVVDEIFPPSFYADLIAGIPDRDRLETYAPGIPRESCTMFVLPPEQYEAASDANREIFATVRAAFPPISEAIAEKLRFFHATALDQVFPGEQREREAEIHHSLSMTVLDRQPAAGQGPHTDSVYRLATWLLYLAPDDSAPEMGTELYRVTASQEDPLRLFFLTQPHLGRGVEVEYVRTLEYRPNRLIAIANGPFTFHGGHMRSPPPAGMARRMSMNNYIEVSAATMPKAFRGVPRELFDLHYDHIWKPEA